MVVKKGHQEEEKAGADERRQSSKGAATRRAAPATAETEWIVGEAENFSGTSSSDSNGLVAMGVLGVGDLGMNKGRADSIFVHADELNSFQSELVEYGDMKLENDESGAYDPDNEHGDDTSASAAPDPYAVDSDEPAENHEDEIWKELQSTYKIDQQRMRASAVGVAGDDEHDHMLNLYANADVMYRHQQHQLEQQNRMLVMSFEEEKTNIDLGEEDLVSRDVDRIGVKPAVSNGWA